MKTGNYNPDLADGAAATIHGGGDTTHIEVALTHCEQIGMHTMAVGTGRNQARNGVVSAYSVSNIDVTVGSVDDNQMNGVVFVDELSVSRGVSIKIDGDGQGVTELSVALIDGIVQRTLREDKFSVIHSDVTRTVVDYVCPVLANEHGTLGNLGTSAHGCKASVDGLGGSHGHSG